MKHKAIIFVTLTSYLSVFLSVFLFGALLSAQVPLNNIDKSIYITDDISMETVFNVPKITGRGHIDKKLKQLFASTVPGSKVYGSIYKSTNKDMARAIVKSYKRNTQWNIIMDDIQRRNWLYKGFTKVITKAIDVYFCTSTPIETDTSWSGGSCLGTGINHNKFFAFSEITDPKDPSQTIKYVVAQSSHNLSGSQSGKYNDLIVTYGDKQLYDTFVSYWQDMKNFDDTGAPDYTEQTINNHNTTIPFLKTYFSPSTFNFKNPILADLETTICMPGDAIYSAHSWLKGSAAKAILDQLDKLYNLGCKINIIARSTSKENKFVKRLKKTDFNIVFTGKIHSKVFLINATRAATVGVNEKTYITYAGSTNLKDQAFYSNDEVSFRMENKQVLEAYKAYWKAIAN